MKIINFDNNNSILNHFIAQLRDKTVQLDSMRFRNNIERIGEILAYELSKSLTYESKEVITPLGIKKSFLFKDDIVICSILRAGIPLHNGLLNYFDNASSSYISAYRKHKENSNDFEIIVEYLASPDLTNKTLIIADPMLATGSSLLTVYNSILKNGKPKNIHIVSVIGSTEGIHFLNKNLPKNTTLWIAAVDEKLNEKGYIIPGLGDAGDLAFGKKL